MDKDVEKIVKEMNDVRKKPNGLVASSVNGVVAFHKIENIPIAEFNGITLGEKFKMLDKDILDQLEKNKILKKAIKMQGEQIKKIKGVLEKYGMELGN